MAYKIGESDGKNAPVWGAVAVTPADGSDLARLPTRSLYIGVTGDVKVDMMNGDLGITFKAVPVGVIPVRVTRVYATGTTATNILALY